MKKLLCFLLVSGRLFAADEVWSIAQIGDMHCPAFSVATVATNTIPWILSKTNDGVYNFRGFISAGDCFQQDSTTNASGDGWAVESMTNDLYRLRDAGLFVLTCNGNHDCDYTNYTANPFGYTPVATCWANRASDTNRLWSKIFPNSFFTNQSQFVSNYVDGDSRNVLFAYTNGEIKLLLATYSTLPNSCAPETDYLPQTTWITNLAVLYPEHNLIVMSHFFINGYKQLRYTDGPNAPIYTGGREQNIGPGKEPFLHGFPTSNMLFCIGGHDRTFRKEHIQVPRPNGGHMDVIGFNTQGNGTNSGFVNIYTFVAKERRVHISTYDVMSGRTLTNNDVSLPNNLSQGQDHSWSFPLAIPQSRKIFRLL